MCRQVPQRSLGEVAAAEFLTGHEIASSIRLSRLVELAHRFRVGEQLEGVFERLEFLGTDQHGSGTTVAGDDDPIMGVLDPVDHLGELRLHVRQRQRLRHDHDSSHPFAWTTLTGNRRVSPGPDRRRSSTDRRTAGAPLGRGRAATSALSRNSLIKLRSTLSQALTWAQRRDLVTRNVAARAELPTGATNTDGSVTIGATKTPGSIRTLEAPDVVLESLERHRHRQDEHADALGAAWSNPDNLVFTSPSGRPADPKAVRNEFDDLITTAGIEGRWTPNLLRHTAASLMADAGLPIEHVADQLGHRDLRMLQQHYRHRIKPTIGGAHILDSVLGANPPSPGG